MKLDFQAFEGRMDEMKRLAARNAQTFGESVARAFERRAKAGAPWVDRTGAARRNLYGKCTASGGRVIVEMGGRAPNYKAGRRSYPDYMEILEFGGGSLSRSFPDLSIVYPTFDSIKDEAVRQYGECAIKASGGIYRDRAASRRRVQAFRRRAR